MSGIMTIEPAAVAPAPPEKLRPVATSERVETIDILRGMALFGILAANIRGFAGPALVYFTPHLFWTALHDRLAQAFVDTFIQGKFITIFAFLFGVGFAMQFDRANEKGARFGWTYARRLGLLLLFGLIHGLLIWFGDVLLVYALDGFLLMLFRKRTNKTVAIWAVILLSILPLLLTGMFVASQFGAKMPDPTPKPAEIAADASVYENGSFAEITKQRSADAVTHNWGFFPVMGGWVLSIFLLGVLAWRKRFFHPAPESLPRYRQATWWALAVGIAGNIAITVIRWIWDPPPFPDSLIALTLVPLQTLCTPALSLGYICAVILLCHSDAWRARLHRFAAIGRTALTNYLLQSLVGTLIFYGYGLGFFGVGPAALLPLTVLLFAAQMYLSPWWLRRYRFGPVEWLWRRLTYGGPLAMRREGAGTAPTVPSDAPAGL
jgi:uncharacterized protein